MTKKHFIKLAKLIKDNSHFRNNPMLAIDKSEFVNGLCDFLSQENPNFDEVKFREATGEITGM